MEGFQGFMLALYRALHPLPPREVRACTPLEIAGMLGWDLEDDTAHVDIGAPLPTDLITRPADAPSPKSRRARKRKAKGGDES